jgi:hypothetical protein
MRACVQIRGDPRREEGARRRQKSHHDDAFLSLL